MQNPPNYPSPYGHSIYGTTLALTSSDLGPHHSIEDISSNYHCALDTTLFLNSPSTLPPQNQTFPVLRQLISHHNVDATRTRISNSSVPFDFHGHNTSASYSIQPHNTVNINIVMGNNSSININLPNSKPPSHFAGHNSFTTSSSTPLLRNHVYNPASLNFHQPYLTLDSNPGPISDRISGTNVSPEFVRHHSQHTYPIVATVEKTLSTYDTDCKPEIPTLTPCLRHNTINFSPHQAQPCQRTPNQNRTISHSGMDYLFNQSSRFFPGEKHNCLPALPSSTLNLPKHHILVPDGENGTFHENSIYRQSNLPSPESHPASDEATNQVPEPNFNFIPQPQTEVLQPLPLVPSQNDNKNAKIEFDPQASSCRRSSMRHKSHPYKKFGPYTCPHCHVIFQSGYRFAAHTKGHYKNETPAERKKRRERKIRNRDLHIAHSTDGITVMPGSVENKPLVAACITDGKAKESNQGENFGSRIIKEEV